MGDGDDLDVVGIDPVNEMVPEAIRAESADAGLDFRATALG
jgi:hypothetical protein